MSFGLKSRFGAAVRRLPATLSALFVAAFVLAGLALPGTAEAQVQNRTYGASFGNPSSPSASITGGSYTFDPDTGAVSNVNIRVSIISSSTGLSGSTMVSGFSLTNQAIFFCSTNPCVANSSMALRLPLGASATAPGGVYGVCATVGPAQTGGSGS